MERKYSDSVTPEDVHGFTLEVKKAKKGKKIAELAQTMTETTKMNTVNKLPEVSVMESKGVPGESKPTEENTGMGSKTKMFMHSSKRKSPQEHYDKLIKTTKELSPGEEVYIYSNQKNNFYELQMKELRQQMQNDKGYFYTYSNDHLGLSIDPVNVEEKKKQEVIEEKTVNLFFNLLFLSIIN